MLPGFWATFGEKISYILFQYLVTLLGLGSRYTGWRFTNLWDKIILRNFKNYIVTGNFF